MVTPVNVSYSAASGENVYGGRDSLYTAHVFIGSGQSNNQGRGARVDAPNGSDPGPIAGVKTWRRSQDGTMYSGTGAWYDLDYEYNQYENRNEFGSILKFGLNVSASLVDDNNGVYMIKADGNGKPISGWLNNGAEAVAMYDGHIAPALASLVNDPAIDIIKIHSFFWDQGESDALGAVSGNAYEANQNQLFADIRAFVGIPTLPMIVRVLDSSTGYTYVEKVRTAKFNAAASDANVHNIEGPYFYDIDIVHINGPSQNTVGDQRAAIPTTGTVYNG